MRRLGIIRWAGRLAAQKTRAQERDEAARPPFANEDRQPAALAIFVAVDECGTTHHRDQDKEGPEGPRAYHPAVPRNRDKGDAASMTLEGGMGPAMAVDNK